jgi:4-amino-4-deoxy-L-arabinose transferase-like glycosyltransferase
MRKSIIYGLMALVVIHLILAGLFNLSHDEAYYWLYSLRLDWGYFDHPPVVAIIIRLMSFFGHHEMVVRSGFILLQALTIFILLKMVKPEKHLKALCLFLAFPLASFAGLLALPDLPLMFATALYCWCLRGFLQEAKAKNIFFLGLTIALLFYSKYHGILVIFFTIMAAPRLLLRKEFYLVAFVALIGFLPHLYWQYVHEFATLKYHFFERPKADFKLGRLLEYLGIQIALAGVLCGPVVWWEVIKHKRVDDFERSLKFICLGTLAFFFISTISKKFEANWTIFLTVPLIILSVESSLWEKKWVKILFTISLVIVVFGRLLFVATPEQVKVKRLGEFHGWKNWAENVQAKCADPILANTYQMAAKLAFYLKRPEIHALNYHSRKNQFDFWIPNSAYYQTNQVCYITDKAEFQGEEIVTPEGKKVKIVQAFNPASFFKSKP